MLVADVRKKTLRSPNPIQTAWKNVHHHHHQMPGYMWHKQVLSIKLRRNILVSDSICIHM